MDGNLDAQYALSVMYARGQGVAANPTKADEWLAKAAMLPSDAGLTDLGLKHLKSTNVWESFLAPQQLTLAAVMRNDVAIEELRKRLEAFKPRDTGFFVARGYGGGLGVVIDF